MGRSPTPDAAYTRECVLYLRKSKGKAGIARQRRDCEKLAEQLGWRVIAEFVDVDATAFVKIGGQVEETQRTQRPSYQRMLSMLRADTRDQPLGVIAWHADRLLRDLPECEEFIRICAPRRHPVETSRSGGYELWTPTGRKRLRSDIVDSAFEVDHLIERIESDRDEKAREGRWHGGPVPFGWKYVRLNPDDEERTLVLHPEQAEAIRWAYIQVIRKASLNSIASEWNRRGLRRYKGGLWDSGQVRRILLRSRNAGLLTHRGRIVETELPGGLAEWPPIVSREIWQATVNILTAPGRGPKNSRARKWLGSGLYQCGIEGCGNTLRTGMGKSGTTACRKSVVVYRCRSDEKGHVVRNASHLDAYVSMVIKARLSRPDLREIISREDSTEVDDLSTQLAVQEAELAEWRRLAREGKVSAVAFAEVEQATLARISDLKARLAQAVQTPLLLELLDVDDIAAEWDQQTLEWRRMLLQMLVTVTVHPVKKGRPLGWYPGQPYFDPDAIEFTWHH